MVEVEEKNIIIKLFRSQFDSTMVRWSNADDVGLRNRKMGVGIPRESPNNKRTNYQNNYLFAIASFIKWRCHMMRDIKIILVLIFACMFLPFYWCSSYDNSDVYYYEDLSDALTDIEDECVGRRSKSSNNNSSVSVTFQDNIPTVCLLKNITTDYTILLNNTNLNLNGFELTNNKTTLIRTIGTCSIYNGFLNRSYGNDNEFDGLLISKGSICCIENITFTSKSTNQTNIVVRVYGEMFMANSSIEASSLESDQNITTIAIYGNIFSNIHIEKCNIVAKSDFGRVDGVYVGDVGKIVDSSIVAYANYQSNEMNFTSCAIGCNNGGTLTINNCSVYGIHSGINSSGALYVNAGMYCGYGHGGIYCAGNNRDCVILNATIFQGDMPDGYKDMGVGCMQSGLYIGGGENHNNINVFIDKCTIRATKNSIVLRGTSGEKNNSLYISNTTIDVQHIRVDNNTHRIYIGSGCNFDASHVDIPDVVCIGISYAKH